MHQKKYDCEKTQKDLIISLKDEFHHKRALIDITIRETFKEKLELQQRIAEKTHIIGYLNIQRDTAKAKFKSQIIELRSECKRDAENE